MQVEIDPSARLRLYEDGVRVPVKRLVFPGGEVHVRIGKPLAPSAAVRIVAQLHAAEDILELLLLTNAARLAGAQEIDLTMPYVPYARQDRRCAPGEPLSARVFCDLINAQRFKRVWVLDPHSDVVTALLDRVVVRTAADVLAEVQSDLLRRDRTILVAPDAGALKKMEGVRQRLLCPYIRADKTRDPETGQITGTVVHSEHVGDCDLLVVDDICDGGRTFIELAPELRRLTTGQVNLYVSHAIFSRGALVVAEHFDHVLVANSFIPADQLPSNVHIVL